MMGGGTIDLHKVAPPEILDPRGVREEAFCGLRSWYILAKREGRG
jgi:hypothetical protein